MASTAQSELAATSSPWHLPWEYADPTNPLVQKFRLTGRYHAQFAYTDADQGTAREWETRRFRLGFKTELFHHLELRSAWGIEGIDDEEFDPRVGDLEVLSLKWQHSDALGLTVGKHKAALTAEYGTSADDLIVTERSLLTHAVIGPERPWGLSADGEWGRLSYQAGWFESDAESETSTAFDFSGGSFGMAALAYDFGNPTSLWTEAKVGLHYAHADEISATRSSPLFRDLLSINFHGKSGAFALLADAIAGLGTEGDLVGLILCPSVDLTPQVQAVARLTLATGDADTLRLRSRYEGSVASGRGDFAYACYLGLNYRPPQRPWKLMAGAEYLRIENRHAETVTFDGWTGVLGLRLNF
jgi:phosphate-selective porin OprO and OprP